MIALLALVGLGSARDWRFDVPIDPDQPEARKLLEDELARPEYQAAKPSWWDEMIGNILEWFTGLQPGSAEGPPVAGLTVTLLVVAGLAIVAFLLFGLPRINRRSRVTGSLFGDDDARTAAQMRASAEEAAARGDYVTAIAEMYRSIARGLAERTVLTTSPGTTAHDFATRAGTAFPDSAVELVAAALAFDEVRYLGGSGSAQQFADIAQLERVLRSAHAAQLEAIDA